MTGVSSARLGRLQAAIEADVRARRYFGAVVSIARHGEIARCEAIGHADPESQRPLQRDSVFSLFSVAKAFTNILVFQAIERGDLALTTKVSAIIPEFSGGLRQNAVDASHFRTHGSRKHAILGRSRAGARFRVPHGRRDQRGR